MAKRVIKDRHNMSVIGPHKPRYDFSKPRARKSAPDSDYGESLNRAAEEAGYKTPWQVTQRAQRGQIDARRMAGKYGPVWGVTKSERDAIVATGPKESTTVSEASRILRDRGINVAPMSIQRYAHRHLIPHSIGPGRRVLVPKSYLTTDDILSVRESNLDGRASAAAKGRTRWSERYRKEAERTHVRVDGVPGLSRREVVKALNANKGIQRKKFGWADVMWVPKAEIGAIKDTLRGLGEEAAQREAEAEAKRAEAARIKAERSAAKQLGEENRQLRKELRGVPRVEMGIAKGFGRTQAGTIAMAKRAVAPPAAKPPEKTMKVSPERAIEKPPERTIEKPPERSMKKPPETPQARPAAQLAQTAAPSGEGIGEPIRWENLTYDAQIDRIRRAMWDIKKKRGEI